VQEQLPFTPVAVCSLSRTVTGSFEGSWTIIECGNEKTHNRESRTPLQGKYELRTAVKKLYQLRPKVSASRVSVASRDVNPKHYELRPALSKELYQLHRNIWVYKMSSNWKVLTQFYCTLYIIICTRTELLKDIDNAFVISFYCIIFKPY